MLRRDTKATFRWHTRGLQGCSTRSGAVVLGLVGVAVGLCVGSATAVSWAGENAGFSLAGIIATLMITLMGLVAVGVGTGAILGLLFPEKKYYCLYSGKYQSMPIEEERYRAMALRQMKRPCLVMRASLRAWWWFQDEIYWEDERLSETEIKALILERKRKRKRQVEKAIALMEAEKTGPVRKRESIPDDVKMFVWQRDGGKCVKCGSNEKMEFDHIIPLSMGGSNTARNLQLLCEACNRSKGGSLV